MPYHVYDYMLDDGRHSVEIAYHCQLLGQPNIVLSDEHQAYKWVTQEELQMRAVILRGFAQS